MTIKEGKHGAKVKEGLPKEAFAIVGAPDNPQTWQLPHHTRAIFRALTGRFDIERTVDWDGVSAAVAALSPRHRGEHRVEANPEAIIKAARHLATHYQKIDSPLPDILAVLV